MVELSHVFHGIHRKPEESAYDVAFDEIRRLSRDGEIEGDFRVSVGDRQGDAQVFVTIWRRVPTIAISGWQQRIDASAELDLRHRYDRAFNPGTTTPAEIIASLMRMLLAPSADPLSP